MKSPGRFCLLLVIYFISELNSKSMRHKQLLMHLVSQGCIGEGCSQGGQEPLGSLCEEMGLESEVKGHTKLFSSHLLAHVAERIGLGKQEEGK